MNDDNVFFYAALVLIAFISWVVGRIREAVEVFRERQRNESRQRSGISEAPTGAPEGRKDIASRALRETYRALGIPFPEDQIEVPPPLPSAAPTPSTQSPVSPPPPKVDRKPLPSLSRGERSALARLQKGRTTSDHYRLSPIGTDQNPGATELRLLMRNRSAVRRAILLKEILDPPKALRGEDR